MSAVGAALIIGIAQITLSLLYNSPYELPY